MSLLCTGTPVVRPSAWRRKWWLPLMLHVETDAGERCDELLARQSGQGCHAAINFFTPPKHLLYS
ncbi:MAG: hypothetical protein ACYC7I_10605 [Gammaproteobacteria bacterium]